MLYVLPAVGGARSPGGRSSWGPSVGAQTPPSPPSSWPVARRPRAKIHHPFKQQEKQNESGIATVTDEDDFGRSGKSLSECYFASKGAAVVLSSGGSPGGGTPSRGGSRRPPPASASSTDIQQHLQSMFYLLRPEETLKMAVKLESGHPGRTRYLVVVSRGGNASGGQGTCAEEACLLGIDCNVRTSVGLVLKVLADTSITLDGDGGFSVSVCGRQHIFKPVSVQAMWSALQTLHRVSSGAREQNYFMGGTSHSWVTYYEKRIDSDRSCLNEWHAMDCIESRRPPSPDSVRTKPREREETEQVIRSTLKEIMMSVDLDEVTSKVIRGRLEEDLDMDLGEFKPFIDQEMITILGQMDAPTEIFDHVYLGSEWNASNLDELQKNGVRHILNVTREIDNFFPGMFNYLNIRVYDDEKTDLLKHWDKTFKYISRARKEGSKVLVHCKMGVSRSASVVIAYAMKAFDWDFNKAMKHVKEKRNCIKPNTSFLSQLETYQGILDAMKNKEKLQRSKSETNLKSPGLVSKTDSRIMEPTPLIQALTGRCRERPRSWSPDTRLASQLLPPTSLSLENLAQETKNVLMPCANGSYYSVSQNRIMRIEDGVPSVKHIVNELESQAAAEKKTQRERRNLKLNLANHIDSLKYNNNSDVSSSLDIVGDRTEECDDSSQYNIDRASGDTDIMSNSVQSKDIVDKTETWDPGENHKQTADNLICDLIEIVKCDSGIVDMRTKPNKLGADLFSKQVDNVFDKEERRGEAPSRQGSWSSCDSAVGLERNSSWGSYDTRPSRNSSWGSYDEQWNTGTVKRTKQKLEENSAKKICSDAVETAPSEVNEAINTVLTHKLTVVPPSCDLDIINENHEQQHGGVVNCSNITVISSKDTNGTSSDSCNSEVGKDEDVSAILEDLEFTGDDLSNVGKRGRINFTHLSASAPTTSSNFFDKIPTSPSASSVGNIFNNSKSIDLPNNKTSIVKAFINSKHKTINEFKVDRSVVMQTANNNHNNNNSRTISGKVKNLKMEFEAKSNLNNDTNSGVNNSARNFLNVDVSVQNVNSSDNNNKSKGRSLPSSPVSVHTEIHSKPVVDEDQSSENSSTQVGHTTSLEDLSVKVLVGKYDRPKSQQITSKTNFAEPPVPMRQSSLNLDTKKKQPTPGARNSICGGIPRNPTVSLRPPVAPTVVAMSPIHIPSAKVVVASVVAKAQTKKQQQHGKTHPLARLKNHTTNRCTNPVYNTM